MKHLSSAVQLLMESMALLGEGREVCERTSDTGYADSLRNWPAGQGWLASESNSLSPPSALPSLGCVKAEIPPPPQDESL